MNCGVLTVIAKSRFGSAGVPTYFTVSRAPGAPAALGDVRSGPLWQALVQRNGRRFGFRYATSGIHPDFVAGSGFISRGNIARASASHRLTFFNAPSSRVLSYGGDVLFSYQPSPGTVFFAGYGSSAAEPDPLRFGQLRRTQDGFFLKWSYLFRV